MRVTTLNTGSHTSSQHAEFYKFVESRDRYKQAQTDSFLLAILLGGCSPEVQVGGLHFTAKSYQYDVYLHQVSGYLTRETMIGGITFASGSYMIVGDENENAGAPKFTKLRHFQSVVDIEFAGITIPEKLWTNLYDSGNLKSVNTEGQILNVNNVLWTGQRVEFFDASPLKVKEGVLAQTAVFDGVEYLQGTFLQLDELGEVIKSQTPLLSP